MYAYLVMTEERGIHFTIVQGFAFSGYLIGKFRLKLLNGQKKCRGRGERSHIRFFSSGYPKGFGSECRCSLCTIVVRPLMYRYLCIRVYGYRIYIIFLFYISSN